MNLAVLVPSLGGIIVTLAIMFFLSIGYSVPLGVAVIIGLLSGAGMQAGLKVFWFESVLRNVD